MMKRVCFGLGMVGLGLVIVPAFLFMTGAMSCEACMKHLMLAGTALWFIVWPIASRDQP